MNNKLKHISTRNSCEWQSMDWIHFSWTSNHYFLSNQRGVAAAAAYNSSSNRLFKLLSSIVFTSFCSMSIFLCCVSFLFGFYYTPLLNWCCYHHFCFFFVGVIVVVDFRFSFGFQFFRIFKHLYSEHTAFKCHKRELFKRNLIFRFLCLHTVSVCVCFCFVFHSA